MRRLVSAALAAVIAGSPAVALASGFYTADRGVRPLGRGGAFVAGADDLGAIAYNPAGIFDAGTSLLIDASMVLFRSDYTRQALLRQVDPNTGEVVAEYEQTFPTIEGSGAPLPIPTVAASFIVHPDWRVAIGAHVPYATLPSYPEELEDGTPSPGRYQLVTLEGSVLAVVGGYVAWRPIKPLTIGAGFELLVGSFKSQKYLSGCVPERFFCSSEDPDWDVATEITAAPIVAPSGNLGLIWEFYESFRLGASFHLPFWIDAPATVHTRLPSTPVFRSVEQVGEDASIQFMLPWEVRLGLEMRDIPPGLRVEIGADYHHWAVHDQILVEPEDIVLTDIPGFPKEYALPAISIERGFQGTVGARIGAEYSIKATDDVEVTPRAGFSYETSAVPAEYQSLLLLDAGKATPSVGLGVQFGNARFDVVYAHQFYPSVEVAPEDAKLPQTLPLQANAPDRPDYINGGIYNWGVDVVGLGFQYTFDKGAPAVEDEEAETPAPAPKPTVEPPSEEE
ncbi:MAG: outer membrane protein transport protein [Myxococcales bacterium]|nr:outer membrane protein transport protein [Myxococcales bacterium]